MAHATPPRSRRGSVLLAALLALVLALPVSAQSARIGGSLQNAIAAAAPGDALEVIVTFDGQGAPSAQNVAALQALGLPGLMMEALPIAGVVATPAQIDALAGTSGVRSLWLNERLERENERATQITGVDRLRTDPALRTALGLPFSGKGIGVLVNDSGVDGTHADLQRAVVQNVAAQTNLRSLSDLLPVTYTEDVPNTDIAGGHGTHVAGIVAGNGARSSGRHEGVAPGASIIGYGSGAGLFILDTIGGFDYALTHQFEYNIRVVSNSFGSTGDVGTPFDPDHPTNVATKALADRGVVVVFSAGNSGAGEGTITGNFKKAPWVVMVAAGDSYGALASFSSRGIDGRGGEVVVDGETFTWVDRPTVTAPGVDVVSVRASLGTDADDSLEPALIPFYTTLSGTSMSCPHVSGIVALLLEADPTLDVYAVRDILERTATNMPGRAAWEAGAGYVNAYAAVQTALGREGFGATVNALNTFNANAQLAGSQDFSIFFSPVGETDAFTFEVAEGITLVKAAAQVEANTVALVLIDPNGNRYGSGITLPILGENAGVSAPGVPGTWTITVRGIGSISGVGVDPLGVTNGTALPGTIDATVRFVRTDGFSGLDDMAGHPAQGFVETGVTRRAVDGRADGTFGPDDALTRGEMAQYLVMGAGARAWLPYPGGSTYGDVSGSLAPFVEAVTARGAALKDRRHAAQGLVRTTGSAFDPSGAVSRADLAYSLVQALGFGAIAADYSGDVFASFDGNRYRVEDTDAIPADLRGYVQLALDAGLMAARFSLEQGPFDIVPTIKARFVPAENVSRAHYAAAAVRLLDVYDAADAETYAPPSSGKTAGTQAPAVSTTGALSVAAAGPNPFRTSTTIAFTMEADGPARAAAYDALGRQVQVLLDDADLQAGQHTVRFDGSDLAAGTYVIRVESGAQVATQRVSLVR